MTVRRCRRTVRAAAPLAGLLAPVAVASRTQLVAYRIAWAFATTGTTAGDNALQSKTVTAGFTWELQQRLDPHAT